MRRFERLRSRLFRREKYLLSEQGLFGANEKLRAQRRIQDKLEKKIALQEEQILDKTAQLDTYVKNLLDERKAARDRRGRSA